MWGFFYVNVTAGTILMMKGVSQTVIFEGHYQLCFSLIDTLLSWLFSPPMLALLSCPKLWQWPSRKQLKETVAGGGLFLLTKVHWLFIVSQWTQAPEQQLFQGCLKYKNNCNPWDTQHYYVHICFIIPEGHPKSTMIKTCI